MAKAAGLEISNHELDRIAGPLQTLELAFRPLAKDLRAGDEPAVIFDAGETA